MKDTAILQGISIVGGVALFITHAVVSSFSGDGDGALIDAAYAMIGFGLGSVATEKVIGRRKTS